MRGPDLFDPGKRPNILVIAGPIWLGDNSSETKKIIERLYAHSGELNDKASGFLRQGSEVA